MESSSIAGTARACAICEHCQKTFKAATAIELPRTNDPQNPARRAYILWRQQRLFDLWQLWDREVRKINPNSCVIPNTGGGATSSLDMKRIGELAPTLMADRQARRGVTVPVGEREKREGVPRDHGPQADRRHLQRRARRAVSLEGFGAERRRVQLWADGVANDLRPWFTKFSGTLHDERWLKPVEQCIGAMPQWEKYLRNERPSARVAVVYSQQTGWFGGGKVEDHIDGWYQALIESACSVRDGARPLARGTACSALSRPSSCRTSRR
jgi:hypothetical protein